MKKLVYIVIVAIAAALYATNVYALDMEYYTYNGFNVIVGAWQQTAMVFSNSNYGMLFYSVIFAAMLFGSVATYYKLFQGSNISPLSWALPLLFGVILYIGVFVPKASFHVYDPVLNKYQQVSNIPQGIVAIAGVVNLIERGIVEIIETSGAPLSYKQFAGGVGFDSLLKASSSLSLNDKYIETSAARYITDCLYFELNRPGTTLTISDIMNNTGTLLTLFGEAANPAIFTVWFDSANTTGATMACYDAYTNLNSYFSDPAKMNEIVRSKCANAGFNPDDANQFAQCKQALEATLQYATGNSLTTEKYFQQVVLAQQLSSAATSGGVDQAIQMKGNVNTMASMYGTGMQANEWIPLIRAAVTAVAIGLMPVLVIFIPTGIGHKALGMIAGFFIWLAFWGVTDVIIHQLATDYSYKFFEQSRQNNVGYASIMAMPDAAAKSLALFGLLRSVGMGLATAITYKIVSFVDAHSMSMVGGQLSGNVQHQGASAGEMAKIEGTAEAVRGPVAAEAVMANAYKYGTGGMAAAAAADQMTQTGSSLGSIGSLGGGNVHTAVDRMAGANVTQKAEDVGRAEGKGGPVHSEPMGRQQGQQAYGAAQQDARMAQALGVSQQELGAFRQNGVVTDKMAPAIGKSLGLNESQSRGLAGARVNPNDLSVNQNTGGLMLSHAEKQSADGKTTWDHGMVTQERTMGGSQILDKAQELEKSGHVEAAEGMRKLVGAGVTSSDGKLHGSAEHGRGLLANESATFMEKRSFDGKTAEVGARHGSDVSWYDTSSDRQGRTVDKGDHTRVGNTEDRGDHTTLGNTVTLNDGTTIPSQSAAQMALSGKPLLVSQVTKPNLSNDQRDAQRLAVAAAVSDGMASLITRRGTSEDSSGAEASASAGIGIPGTKIGVGGSTSVGYRTSDQFNSSLMAQRYDSVMKSAQEEASAKGMSRADTNVLMSQRLQGAVQEEKAYFEEHGKWSYGASGAAARVGSALKGNKGDTTGNSEGGDFFGP